jgi:hypothetical protein
MRGMQPPKPDTNGLPLHNKWWNLVSLFAVQTDAPIQLHFIRALPITTNSRFLLLFLLFLENIKYS